MPTSTAAARPRWVITTGWRESRARFNAAAASCGRSVMAMIVGTLAIAHLKLYVQEYFSSSSRATDTSLVVVSRSLRHHRPSLETSHHGDASAPCLSRQASY